MFEESRDEYVRREEGRNSPRKSARFRFYNDAKVHAGAFRARADASGLCVGSRTQKYAREEARERKGSKHRVRSLFFSSSSATFRQQSVNTSHCTLPSTEYSVRVAVAKNHGKIAALLLRIATAVTVAASAATAVTTTAAARADSDALVRCGESNSPAIAVPRFCVKSRFIRRPSGELVKIIIDFSSNKMRERERERSLNKSAKYFVTLFTLPRKKKIAEIAGEKRNGRFPWLRVHVYRSTSYELYHEMYRAV